MSTIEEEKAAVRVLIEDKAGHTKDIQEKLLPCLASPYTGMFFYAGCILSCILNVILVSVIIVLAIQVNPVSNTGESETKNQICAPCEDDWIWYRGQCYYFSKERDTWNNSQRFCISHNSSLTLIDNQEELDFFNQHKGSDNHWIGLRRTGDNKDWIWTNGTLYNESLFKIVRSSSKTPECVFLNHEGVKSLQWTYKHKWICKKTGFPKEQGTWL